MKVKIGISFESTDRRAGQKHLLGVGNVCGNVLHETLVTATAGHRWTTGFASNRAYHWNSHINGSICFIGPIRRDDGAWADTDGGVDGIGQ